jgi:hypothetical protein
MAALSTSVNQRSIDQGRGMGVEFTVFIYWERGFVAWYGWYINSC